MKGLHAKWEGSGARNEVSNRVGPSDASLALRDTKEAGTREEGETRATHFTATVSSPNSFLCRIRRNWMTACCLEHDGCEMGISTVCKNDEENRLAQDAEETGRKTG